MSKPVSNAPKRLQGMMLELQRYRYDINIIFKPGKDIPVTDCLTRKLATILKPDKQDNLSTRLDAAVHSLVTSLPISDPKLNEIRTCTANAKACKSSSILSQLDGQINERTVQQLFEITGITVMNSDIPMASSSRVTV